MLDLLLLTCWKLSWAHPDTHIKDLVPVFPHHKAGQQAYQATDQVQNHLDGVGTVWKCQWCWYSQSHPRYTKVLLRGSEEAVGTGRSQTRLRRGKLCELGIVVSGDPTASTQTVRPRALSTKYKSCKSRRRLSSYRECWWLLPKLQKTSLLEALISSETWCLRRDNGSLWTISELPGTLMVFHLPCRWRVFSWIKPTIWA